MSRASQMRCATRSSELAPRGPKRCKGSSHAPTSMTAIAWALSRGPWPSIRGPGARRLRAEPESQRTSFPQPRRRGDVGEPREERPPRPALITCRNPIPRAGVRLKDIPVGPLSPAETRKLVLRLDALDQTDERARILSILGGHPRSLEFVNVLLGGKGRRLPAMLDKLEELLGRLGLDADSTFDGADQALQQALALGARDIMLKELLAIARDEQIDAVLLQVAASNLPVTPAGAARMLASGDASRPGDAVATDQALAGLKDMALLHRAPDGSAWVYRWTAEGLAELDATNHAARCVQAGRYRMWRVQNESHSLEDGVEAVRNFLKGSDLDAAVDSAKGCLEAMRQFQRSLDVAALASEVLETLPETHAGYVVIADQEAQAHLALGQTTRALRRYDALLVRNERLAQAEPDRADYERDLSVSYNKVGDLYRRPGPGGAGARGLPQVARDSPSVWRRRSRIGPTTSATSRCRTTRWATCTAPWARGSRRARPTSSRSRSPSVWRRRSRIGPTTSATSRCRTIAWADLYGALGQGEQAREAYLKSLAIRERLAQAEPDRADYQRDLSVSYEQAWATCTARWARGSRRARPTS